MVRPVKADGQGAETPEPGGVLVGRGPVRVLGMLEDVCARRGRSAKDVSCISDAEKTGRNFLFLKGFEFPDARQA